MALGLALAAGTVLPAQAQQDPGSAGQQTSPLPGFLDRQTVHRTPDAPPPVGTAAPREPAPQGVPLAPVAPAASPYVPALPPPASAEPASNGPASAPPANTAPSGSAAAVPLPAPTAAPATPQYPDLWQPRQGAELVGLDKVSAHATPLSGGLGQPLAFGTLRVVVRACLVRPADQPADAAAFLEITDSTGAVPPFRGWVWAEEPERNVYEHPLYDLRLTGCRGG